MRVRVAIEVLPPNTVDGASVSELGVDGSMVSVAVGDCPPSLAVITANTWLLTTLVVMENVAVLEPAATVTEVGTVAKVELQDSVTNKPSTPAGPSRVTVPVAVNPPRIGVGLTETDANATGLIPSVAL